MHEHVKYYDQNHCVYKSKLIIFLLSEEGLGSGCLSSLYANVYCKYGGTRAVVLIRYFAYTSFWMPG
jgi:hypothetical protein